MRPLLARALLALATLVAAWAMVALVTGGFRLQLAGVVLSSRNPVRPAVVALILFAAAWWLDPPRISRAARALAKALGGLEYLVTPAAALAVLIVCLSLGGRVALGADEFGYISQSVLWLRGAHLKIEQPFVALMPWPEADWTFAPLGYRPAAGYTLVPTYAPGLPLLLAGARLISRCAPYFVVPVCAAALVLLTGLLGRRLFGVATATAGAVLVAASPVVLTMGLATMTDIPVATFWIAALVAADRGSVKGAALAGALSGVAAMIRPNLAPLAIFPLLLSAAHGGGRRAIVTRGLALSLAVAPFAFLIGLVHNTLYGSPFTSGYGSASTIYSWRYFLANASRYPAWWWHTHGIIGWLFVVGMFRARPPETRLRVAVVGYFAIAVVLSYVFYLPFEHWAFLRFMLPAVPIALLFSADAVAWLAGRFGPVVSATVTATVVVLALMQGIHLGRQEGFFRNGAADQRYADAGVYIGSATPPSAVVLSMQHSGSIRFYSGRLTLRYDLLNPAWLDRAVARLQELGFSPYALLEEWEEETFRKRFSNQQTTRLLDAGPLAVRKTPGGELRLFALSAAAVRPGSMAVRIPRTSRFDCIDVSPQFGLPVQVPAVRALAGLEARGRNAYEPVDGCFKLGKLDMFLGGMRDVK